MMKSRRQERVKAVSVNPFLTVMYKSMSFKAWLKIYRENYKKRREEIDFGVDRDSSDEELDGENEADYEIEVIEDVTVVEEEELDHDLEEEEEILLSENHHGSGPKQELEPIDESDEEEGFRITLKETLRAPSNSKLNQGSRTPTPSKSRQESDNLVVENEEEEGENFNSQTPINN